MSDKIELTILEIAEPFVRAFKDRLYLPKGLTDTELARRVFVDYLLVHPHLETGLTENHLEQSFHETLATELFTFEDIMSPEQRVKALQEIGEEVDLSDDFNDIDVLYEYAGNCMSWDHKAAVVIKWALAQAPDIQIELYDKWLAFEAEVSASIERRLTLKG